MNNKWQNAVRSMEQRMESLRLNMHGYQILYRGELIGERYWEPFHRGQPAPDVFDYEELHLAGDGTAGSGGQDWLRRSDLYVFSGKAAGGWRTSMVRRNDDPGFTYDAYLL